MDILGGSTFGVQIPQDLEDEPANVLKVYVKLVRLAKSNESNSFDLPPREIFSAVCKLSRETISKSLRRLHALNWITILNLSAAGKTTRRRILVKYDEPRLINERVIVEMLQTLRAPSSNPPITFSSRSGFDDGALIAIANCKLKDKSDRMLKDIPEKELYQACKNADNEDVIIAANELNQYRPGSGGPVRSIVGLFSKMFIRSNGGGMLNPYRKSLIQSVRAYAAKSTTKAHTAPANFFPCLEAGMPPSHIDYLAEQLNERNWMDAGLVPIRQLVANDIIFLRHTNEAKIKLRDEFELVRVKKGFWNVNPITVKFTDRRGAGGPRSLAEVMENV